MLTLKALPDIRQPWLDQRTKTESSALTLHTVSLRDLSSLVVSGLVGVVPDRHIGTQLSESMRY